MKRLTLEEHQQSLAIERGYRDVEHLIKESTGVDFENFLYISLKRFHEQEVAALNEEIELLKSTTVKIEQAVFPINSEKYLLQNVVAILTLMGDPNLTTKEEVLEINTIASEMFIYLKDKQNG